MVYDDANKKERKRDYNLDDDTTNSIDSRVRCITTDLTTSYLYRWVVGWFHE